MRDFTPAEALFSEECWRKTIHCLGTSAVVCLLAKRLDWYKRLVDFGAVLVPILIAWIHQSINPSVPWQVTAFVAGVVYLLTTWTIFSNWSEKVHALYDSEKENRELAEEYRKLITEFAAENIVPSSVEQELAVAKEKFEAILKRDNKRNSEDRRLVPDRLSLLQYGMRFALRQIGRKCADCGEVPKNMKPSSCNICGNFSKWKWRI